MEHITLKLLEKDNFDLILPLVSDLNPGLSEDLLKERLQEMSSQNYQCLIATEGDTVVGVCGFWITTRFYCGKQVEVDNVVVSESMRSKGLGKQMMQWIYDYGRSIGCKTCELNTYVTNSPSHKFYYNEGFAILGFHMQKEIG